MLKHGAIALAAVIGLGLTAPAFAGTDTESQEQQALQNTNVSLTQAITEAEHLTGGKAYDAGVDIQNGKSRISVETNGPQGVQTVLVDSATGKVIGRHAGGEQDNESEHED